MKKSIAVLLALTLLFCAWTALADTQVYSDEQYSFQYPVGWTQGMAADGSIILMNEAQDSAIMTFSVYLEVNPLSGDAEANRETILSMISDYAEEKQREKGKNTVLDGTYEEIAYGAFSGFRAFGKWLVSGDELIMDILYGENHMISFVFIGGEAISLEDFMLNSVEVNGSSRSEAEGGFARWDGPKVSFLYPETYSALEQATGIILSNTALTNTAIAVRIYSIDYDYSDEYAAAMASASLPKSTKVEADPEMVKVGDWNAAVIRGEMSSGPMSYYVIGSGQTVLGIIFMGEEAITFEEAVVGSMEIR